VASVSIARPMPFRSAPIIPMRFRFTCGTSAVFKILRSDMLSRLAMTSSTVAGYRIFAGVKLNRIKIWGPTPAPTATSQVSLQWISENGPPELLSDYSSSTAYPPFLESTPPKQSLASFWSIQGIDESDLLFMMELTAQSIVEIDVSVVFTNTAMAVVSGNSSTVLSITYASGGGFLGAPALDHSGSDFLVAEFWPNLS
jgi:hypothetical protein